MLFPITFGALRTGSPLNLAADLAMNLCFQLSRTLSALDLRIPFPVQWMPITGAHHISAEVTLRGDTHEQGWKIPEETLFSISIEPGVEGFAAGCITLQSFVIEHADVLDWATLREAYEEEKALPFGRALARQMFNHPNYPWSVAETAASLGTDSRGLRARLFREAYSFSSTQKRCRMLRLFLSALSEDCPFPDQSASGSKFRASKLDSIFEAAHGAKLSSVVDSQPFRKRVI